MNELSKHTHNPHDHSGHHSPEHQHDSHQAVKHGEHGGHAAHAKMFKKQFLYTLALAIPIIFLSPIMGMKLPFQFSFPGSDWIVAILATIIFFYGGAPFLSGAKSELAKKTPGMMTLVSMGIIVSYCYSIYAFISNKFLAGPNLTDFFWELVTLVAIMLLGHWMEMKAVANASSALEKLAELLPSEVTRINGEKTEQISLEEVSEGDLLLVRAGDKIPADGTIESGSTTVDESAVTGESRAVEKDVDSKVIGGSINGEGTFHLRVTGTGETGFLSQVMNMVRKAQDEKSKFEVLSDRVAKWLFYVAVAVSIIAFIAWLIATDMPTALKVMVTVLVIACPHALGLAIPLVISRSTSIAASNGLLLKNRAALETANGIDTILLDKTGTLTKGNFEVTGVTQLADLSEEELLPYVAGLENTSTHPIAKSIMSHIKEQGIEIPPAEDTENIAGKGLRGIVNGSEIKIINHKELKNLGLSVEESQIQSYLENGNTLSFILVEGKLVGVIALGDTVKPEAKPFIEKLKERGIVPIMATGDNQESAQAVANHLGIETFYAEMLPEDKEKRVKELMSENKKVAMVGDGINDAPSLARATVGIAIGAGTDVSIESADVVLTDSNPEDILHLLDLATNTHRKMVQNIWWGAGYNIVALPLAAGVLAPVGILLNPAVGAILMSLSTVIVAINAMTLKIKN